jgi:sulfate/thiosulfate-binding protein
MTSQRRLPTLIAGLIVGLALFAAAGATAAKAETINLVAYSTPQDAYKRIIPLFQKTKAGKGVQFTQSYGASGDQSRAVAAGQPASVVHLALEPDMTRLVPKFLAPNWNANRTHGIVADSVVALVVRKGNPKHIRGWNDLLRSGIKVVTADPISSGGARWNALAAYGAALRASGHDTNKALGYLKQLFKNTPTRPSSARDALSLFSNGYGDVLITYESEAIYAKNHGQNFDWIVPSNNILIQTVVAPTKGAGPGARAFVKFLFTPAAQREFAKVGFRPVIPSLVDKRTYPKPKNLFTIANFGGWTAAATQFFTPKTGLIARAQAG